MPEIYKQGGLTFSIAPNLTDDDLIARATEKINRLKESDSISTSVYLSMLECIDYCTRHDLIAFIMGAKNNFLNQAYASF